MTDASGEPGEAGEPRDAPADDVRPGRATHDTGGAESDSGADFQSHLRAARSEFENQVAQAKADFEEANERIKERTGRDLILAILIGLAIGAALLMSLLFVKWLFLVFALAAVLLAIFEFSRALVASGRRVDLVPQLIAGTLVVVTAYFVSPWLHWVVLFVALAFVIVWRLVAQMASHDGRVYAAVLGDVLIAGLIQLYVAFLGSLCVVLLGKEGGEWWVLGFIVVAAAADTGAYAAGISFGKHPMAPRISPKKTWEGAAGGYVAGVAVAFALNALFETGVDWMTFSHFAFAMPVAAMIGDLVESWIKRRMGVKDASGLLPGHGGFLDRLDSVLFVFPLLWVFLQVRVF